MQPCTGCGIKLMLNSMSATPDTTEGTPVKSPLLINRIFAAIGIMLFIAGCVWIADTLLFVSSASRTSGVVTQVEVSHGRRLDSYTPVFSFVDAGGMSHTQRFSRGSPFYKFAVGEKVLVLYAAQAPTSAKIDSFWTLWMPPSTMAAFGLILGVGSWFCRK
jgi:Protein of unknown function (DUF3592)